MLPKLTDNIHEKQDGLNGSLGHFSVRLYMYIFSMETM